MPNLLPTEIIDPDQSRHCHYLLLDPILRDPQGFDATRGALKHWLEQRPPVGKLVGDPSGARSAMTALRLMTLHNNQALFEQSRAWARDPRFRHISLCGWLESRHSMLAITRHLERAISQRTPGGQRIVLRFHDPRVMNHLLTILTPAQWSVLLGPIKQWIFVDHNGQLKRLRHPGIWQRQLDLTPPQMAAIHRIELINQCLEAWKREQPETDLPDEASAIIDRHLEYAEQYGIEDQASRIAFALQGAWTRPDFHRHSTIQNLLHRMMHSQQRYIALTDALTEADWQEIIGSPKKDFEEVLS